MYSDTLMKFNLHTNTSKSTITFRPFSSRKSQLIYGANDLINSFFEKFLEKDQNNGLKLNRTGFVGDFLFKLGHLT